MLIQAFDLQKKYHTKLSLFRQTEYLDAVNRVSFAVDPNEIVGLVGETGCGKSTVARLLVRLEEPTAGKIVFQGREINRFKGGELKKFRKDCQIIFQDTLASLNPLMRIKDILLEPLNNHFKYSLTDRTVLIEEMLDTVKLDSKILVRYPCSLSGGERQRINICRALLLKPKLLICDEIISSLDVAAQAAILNLLKRLNEQLGMSLLFITHDIGAVRFLSHRIIVMYQGKIVEFINNKQEFSHQIKYDYTRQLLASAPIIHPAKRAI
jgi:ABC-type oligopeptide transport system ATPase subunit